MKLSSLLIIICSFIISFVLTIIKLPTWANYIRPAWIPLILCYWVLALPHQIGIVTAWITGIMLDALNNTLLGEHAFGLIVIAYLVLKLHRQIRVFPIWQQAFMMAVLIALYQFALFWIQGIIGQPTGGGLFWVPAVTSMLFWPIIVRLLHSWRQRFRIY